MNDSAELAGRLFPALVAGCVAVYFLGQGFSSGPRSRRWANLAIFCGLASCVPTEVALGLSPATRPAPGER